MRMKNNTNFISYDLLKIEHLRQMDMAQIQKSGYIFMWTVNQYFQDAYEFLLCQGYE